AGNGLTGPGERVARPRRHPVVAALAAAAALAMVAAPFASSRIADDEKTIDHVLNRIAFGPRPGDVERVRTIGVRAYIDQQLHPERIRDEAADARLARLSTLTMSSRQIAETFEIPQLQARQERKRESASGDTGAGSQAVMRDPERQRANLVLVE